MVQLAPAPAMDEITFRSDTVLSDVHLYTPNHRHLMVRLNGVGQPGKGLGTAALRPWKPIWFSAFSCLALWGKIEKTALFNCSPHVASKCPCCIGQPCASLSTSCVPGPSLELGAQT